MSHYDALKIYIDQLRGGSVEEINEDLSPDFLGVNELELKFPHPVQVTGEAYQTRDELIVHLQCTTQAALPCIICGAPVDVPVNLNGFYLAIPLEEIRSGVYDFGEELREAILLEVPHFAECGGSNNCPERKEIKKFLKKPVSTGERKNEDSYQPFKDL